MIEPYLERYDDYLENALKAGKISLEEKEKVRKALQTQSLLLRDAIEFYSSNFDLETYISTLSLQRIANIMLEGFIPSGYNEGFDWDVTDPWDLTSFLFYWCVNARDIGKDHRIDLDTITLDVLGIAARTGRALQETLERLFPMGPFRKPPERWYISTGTSPEDVGLQGERLPDLLFRHPEFVKEVNDWLEHLDVGYQIKVQPMEPRSRDMFEVRLIDTRRKQPVEVSLLDIGFGISQLLPFIVQSLASEGRIISIEHPEIHVHPKLQADLGNLLAEAIKEPQWNQFLIETHSEHLVLRLQKLVRQKTLTPEDVSILYVSRGSEGSQVQQLRLDENGDFIDEWPGGFFPERLREFMDN